jgi:hypothetical protein
MNPSRIIVNQLADALKITATCRCDDDFEEVALISGELNLWHLRPFSDARFVIVRFIARSLRQFHQSIPRSAHFYDFWTITN